MRRGWEVGALGVLLAILMASGLPSCGGDDDDGGPPARIGGEERLGTAVQGLLVGPAVVAKALLEGTGSTFAVDPSATPEDNAAAVRSAAAAALALPACSGNATVAGSTVTVVFDTGCHQLPSQGIDVQGGVRVDLSGAGGTAVVSFTWSGLSVGGHPAIDGTAEMTIAAGAGTEVPLAVDTTDGSASLLFDGTVDVDGISVVLDGTGTYVAAGVTYDLVLTGITWWVTDCYPDGGTVDLTVGALSETLAFTGGTSMFGTAELTRGGTTESITLAPYGECP